MFLLKILEVIMVWLEKNTSVLENTLKCANYTWRNSASHIELCKKKSRMHRTLGSIPSTGKKKKKAIL
jgi:hypothetical protein